MNGMARKPLQPNEAAEIVGIKALQFLAGDPALLGRFLAETGLGPDSLRQAAKNPQFLGSVLDFVLDQKPTAEAFAQAVELDIKTIAIARYALAGPDWERDDP